MMLTIYSMLLAASRKCLFPCEKLAAIFLDKKDRMAPYRTFIRDSVLVVLVLAAFVHRTNCQPGFLSIDCGSDVDYVDKTTGIKWESDSKYISTGKVAQGITFPSRYVNIVNKAQIRTLRYFDEGLSRNCYVLPMKPETTFLVRATFFYGNWRKAGPSSFRVYLNSTAWLSVASGSGAAEDAPYAYEVILFSTGSVLNFCLVKGTGVPFIAALEVRELSVGMYSSVASSNTFLSLYDRENSGVPLTSQLQVRYPDDIYDRIWYPATYYPGASIVVKPNLTSYSTAPNQPPVKVMQDAWIHYQDRSFQYYQDFGPLIPAIGGLKFKIYGYFQEVDGNASATNVRGMAYVFNGAYISPFNASDEAAQQESPPWAISSTRNFINITLIKTSWSKLFPMVNALECYFQIDANTSVTALQDVKVISSLEQHFNLTSWVGDPCLPTPFEWLSCEPADNTSLTFRVKEILLANKFGIRETAPNSEIPSNIVNLTALTHLNLSSNGLANYPTNLKDFQSLAVLDVSNNNLEGDIGEFLNAVSGPALKEIYAGNNYFEGTFPLETLLTTNIEKANFDKNRNISGTLDLSAWHESLSKSLRVSKAAGESTSPFLLLSLVNNSITDVIPSLEDLDSTIDTFLNNISNYGSGILLGGNPICSPPMTSSLARKYLCRLSINDEIIRSHTQSPTNQKTFAIVLSCSVGSFLLVISCICSSSLWKLRKQTYTLIEIEEALAKQKVQPPFFSYAELKAATKDFSVNNKLGQGAFGAVYKGIGADGAIMAIKKLFSYKQEGVTKQIFTEFLNEVVLITGIKHRNLIQLKGCCIKGDQRILVYEYAENGNLAQALWGAPRYGIEKDAKPRIRLDWTTRFNICVGVARGLSYLHEEVQPRIIHRDIKSANILLDKNLSPKIADFGLARSFSDGQSQDFTQLAGTLGYFAPEYATQGQLTDKADVFSFGVLILEIICGRRCINHTLPHEEAFLLNLARKFYGEGRLLELVDPTILSSACQQHILSVMNIGLLCLQMDPSRRPCMSYVVTMLLGNTDVSGYLEIPVYHLPDYRILSETESSSKPVETPIVGRLSRSQKSRSAKKCDVFPLIEDPGLESSFVSTYQDHEGTVSSKTSVTEQEGCLDMSYVSGR